MAANDSNPSLSGLQAAAEELLRIERDLGVGLSVAGSLAETLQGALEAALRIPGVDCGGVYLLDEATGRVELAANRGVSEPLVRAVTRFNADDPEMRYLLIDRPAYGRAEELSPRHAEDIRRDGLLGLVVIPVKDQGRPVGALVLGSHTREEVAPAARDALASINSRLGGVVSRVRAEEAVVRSKEEWERTFDAVPDLIAIIDCHHRILRMNRAMAERMGVAPTDCVGKTCYECVHLADEPPPHCPHSKLLEDGREHMVEIEDDGRLKGTFLVTTSPIFDREGRLAGSVHVARDITERKHAEERLQESERRLRTIFDNATDVITYVDNSGRIVDVNDRVEEVLGYKREDIAGKNFAQLDLIRKEDIPRLVELFERTLGEGQAVERVELALKHKNGSTVFVEVGTRFIWNNGEVEEIVNIFHDITERKQAETELARAKQASESASRAKSEFLANMSHEIRTPLTAIVGFADLLMSLDLPADVRRQHLETIHANAESLLKLINDVLDLSKIEAEKLEIEPVECPPWGLVEEVRSLMRLRAAEKGLNLAVDYQFPLPAAIRTDPVRLRQILVNLIGNAVKFTDRGEVRIAVRCIRPPDAPARIEFAVSDTGVGMRAEDLGRLFQPFTQIDMSLSRRFGGSGLGLSISQRLAAMLGGRIEPQSRLGRGSTFVLSIDPGPLEHVPLLDRLPKPAEREGEPHKARFERTLAGRVLVVEDSRDVRHLIRLLLEQSGVEVDLAEDGRAGCEKGLASVRGGVPYDLILMDIQLPVMDGYESLRQLREGGWKGPIVALTAHAMSGDREKCIATGFDDYVAKPPRLEQLLDVVERYLLPDECKRAEKGAGPICATDPSGRSGESDAIPFPSLLGSSRFSEAQKAMLLEQFLEGLRERAEEIQSALDRGDAGLLCEAVHALYGTAGMLGFESIAQTARQIELQARRGSPIDALRSRGEELLEICRRVLGF
jgi:PAS domain S-box-containing protein